ncbi:MAG: hypothetical protein Kow00121_30930 [Elainellaceae cyanobacterium]
MASYRLIQWAENKYNRLLTVLLWLVITISTPQRYDFARSIGFILCLTVMLEIVHQIDSGRRLMRFYQWLVFSSLLLILLKMVGLFTVFFTQYGQAAIQLMIFITISFPIFLIEKEIFLTEKVTADTLKGAIAAYLLMGIAWAALYNVVYGLDSYAFNGISSLHHQADSADFLHFSFITLTTVGYGDIEPVNLFARTFADLEAIAGVMYSSILIARLVGLYKSNSQEPI